MASDAPAAAGPRQAVTQGVIPYVHVGGAADAASAFYQRAFGARELGRVPSEDPGRLLHCHLEVNGGSLMMSDCHREPDYEFRPWRGLTMQLVVEDGDAWWRRAVDAGCEVVVPFEVMFWGDRYGQLEDPFGVRWAINEVAERG